MATWSGGGDEQDVTLKGRLCDLPTVVETYKTTDKKTFYKSGTISQMLVCAEAEGDINPRNKKYHGSKDPRRFQMFHGLTPPLKNVKKSRFRKIIRKRHCEAPEVEKELKRLLRDDMDAETVDFELVPDPEWEKKSKSKNANAIIPDMTSSEDSNDDDDDEEDKPDFDQHRQWALPENDNGRCGRLQQQAEKLSQDIVKLRNRQGNRQRELDSAHKEEKKERLRQDIEDIKHKEKEKEKQYFETLEKYSKRIMKVGLKP